MFLLFIRQDMYVNEKVQVSIDALNKDLMFFV